MYAVEVAGQRLRFETAPGIFSADGPDPGSMLLLETVRPSLRPHQRVLDLGCGAGLIGIALSLGVPRGEVWMVDMDVRAVRCAERNVELNRASGVHVFLGDGARDLPPGSRFDLVVTNPPTHDGKDVLAQLVEDAYKVLRPGGSLFVVVNRLLSIKVMMEAAFENVEIAGRRKGFIVLASKKVRRP